MWCIIKNGFFKSHNQWGECGKIKNTSQMDQFKKIMDEICDVKSKKLKCITNFINEILAYARNVMCKMKKMKYITLFRRWNSHIEEKHDRRICKIGEDKI